MLVFQIMLFDYSPALGKRKPVDEEEDGIFKPAPLLACKEPASICTDTDFASAGAGAVVVVVAAPLNCEPGCQPITSINTAKPTT